MIYKKKPTNKITFSALSMAAIVSISSGQPNSYANTKTPSQHDFAEKKRINLCGEQKPT